MPYKFAVRWKRKKFWSRLNELVDSIPPNREWLLEQISLGMLVIGRFGVKERNLERQAMVDLQKEFCTVCICSNRHHRKNKPFELRSARQRQEIFSHDQCCFSVHLQDKNFLQCPSVQSALNDHALASAALDRAAEIYSRHPNTYTM